MGRNYRKFTEILDELLEDPKFAEEFLNSALEEKDIEVFFMSLRDIIRVHGSVTSVAEKAGISRSTLYNLLAKKMNPEMKTILSLLDALGYDLKVIKRSESKAA